MNVIKFIESLKDKQVNQMLADMLASNDFDERMSLCDSILGQLWYLEDGDPNEMPKGVKLPKNFDYWEFEGALKDLCIS